MSIDDHRDIARQLMLAFAGFREKFRLAEEDPSEITLVVAASRITYASPVRVDIAARHSSIQARDCCPFKPVRPDAMIHPLRWRSMDSRPPAIHHIPPFQRRQA